jgi:hypothetical protein
VSFALGGSSGMFTKNSDGFELQLADQSWGGAHIVASSGATLTLKASASAQLAPIALRLHWLDSPCCKRFYGNEANYSWQWWGVAQHPVPDAGVCPPRNCSIYSSATGKTVETELPAVPFVVNIDPLAGRCTQFPTATRLIG